MAKTFLINAGALSGARVFLALSQVVVIPIVARFLDPVAFGDMALAMSVVVFSQILSDAGLGRSLIRQKHYNPAEWNSVFWLLVGVGVSLATIILILAPIWARVFERPVLWPMVSILATLPLLNALTAVSIARMEREGQFPVLAAIRIAAGVAGLVAVIGMAVAGFGVWALVGQQLMIGFVQTAAAHAASPFRPVAPRNFTPLGNHLRFAGDNISVSMLVAVQRQVPILMIGSVLGSAQLGFFSMAERVLVLSRTAVAAPVAQVVYPKMSRVQDDGPAVARAYLASCHIIALAICPPMAVLGGGAQALFPLLLSETWAPVATVFALAAPGIMLEISTSSAGVMFQALDRTRLRVRMITEKTILRIVIIGVAVFFGLEAAALGVTVASVIFHWRYIDFAGRVAPVSQLAVLRAFMITSVVSTAAWVVMWGLSTQVPPLHVMYYAAVILPLTWGLAVLLQLKRVGLSITSLNT